MTNPDTPAAREGVELLACPFCDGEAFKSEIYYGGPWRIWCENHGKCHVLPAVNERTEADATAAWNTRTATRANEDEVAILEMMLLGAQDRATKAEAEVAQLREQLKQYQEADRG